MKNKLFRIRKADALEDRIVGSLRREGLIRAEYPWYLHRRAAAGALALLLAILLWVGQGERTPLPDGNQYMLALYTGPAYRPAPEGHAQARAEEYGRWAEASRVGRAAVVGGEELGGTVATLGRPTDGAARIAGFFLVKAASPADAVALARTSPHLRHGGTIVVREIRE